jgi:adenylylsulfate kinase
MLILMAGLPGTGKTTFATRLAERLAAVVLSKDVLRHALFPPDLIEYSTEQDDFVIDVLLRTAAYIWRRDSEKSIILDGRTFSRAWQRQNVIAFADRANQDWRIIECVCPDDIAKSRLSKPDPNHPAGNRTPALHDEVKARWEPIAEPHITVSTDSPVNIEGLVAALK